MHDNQTVTRQTRVSKKHRKKFCCTKLRQIVYLGEGTWLTRKQCFCQGEVGHFAGILSYASHRILKWIGIEKSACTISTRLKKLQLSENRIFRRKNPLSDVHMLRYQFTRNSFAFARNFLFSENAPVLVTLEKKASKITRRIGMNLEN